jgi:DNA-nicking Smr family endonuclease
VSKKKKTPEGPFSKLEGLKKKLAEEESRKGQGTRTPARRAPEPKPSADDEALTFHRLMSGVVPLDAGHGRVSKTEGAGPSKAVERLAASRTAHERAEADAQEHLRELVEGNQRFEVMDDGRRVEGRRVDVPPDVVRKLRRGFFPIDARLDLHGLRAGEARTQLLAFLRDKRARGEKCVLVIHGRGEHSAGFAVLRGEIAAWLSQGPASEHVAAFATAHGEDGGEGATYVLLRR